MTKVIDTNVLIHGRSSEIEGGITVPGVVEEVVSDSARRSQQVVDLEVYEPSAQSLEKIRNLSSEINSPTSKTDEELVALAYEREALLVSDDKAVQNLAKHLGIKFEGYMKDEIEGEKEWKVFCPTCGEEKDSKCSKCGREPIRRPV